MHMQRCERNEMWVQVMRKQLVSFRNLQNFAVTPSRLDLYCLSTGCLLRLMAEFVTSVSQSKIYDK